MLQLFNLIVACVAKSCFKQDAHEMMMLMLMPCYDPAQTMPKCKANTWGVTPMIGANLMSTSFAHAYLGNEPLAPTRNTLRLTPRSSLESKGVLHDVHLHLDDTILALDFHDFNIQDFDVLMGHPLEKTLLRPTKNRGSGRKAGERQFYHSYHYPLDVKLGRDNFTIPITQAKNSVAESLPYPNLPKVMSVLPFDSPELSLEKDVKLFIEEEDDLGEAIDLPTEKVPP
jgi:hypothetical protein